MDSLPIFLAHALAMEAEAAERYLELADMMEAHRNDDVSAVFRDMVKYSKLHHASIAERAKSVDLPTLRPADYQWSEPPEMGDEDAFDYQLHRYHALEYARENEGRAQEFYAEVAEKTTDAEIRSLAVEFAEEEAEHVAALDEWLGRTMPP